MLDPDAAALDAIAPAAPPETVAPPEAAAPDVAAMPNVAVFAANEGDAPVAAPVAAAPDVAAPPGTAAALPETAAALPEAAAAAGAWFDKSIRVLPDKHCDEKLSGTIKKCTGFLQDPRHNEPRVAATELFHFDLKQLGPLSSIHACFVTTTATPRPPPATPRPYFAMVATEYGRESLVYFTGIDDDDDPTTPTIPTRVWRFEGLQSLASSAALQVPVRKRICDTTFPDAPESAKKLYRWVGWHDAKRAITPDLLTAALRTVHVVYLGNSEDRGCAELSLDNLCGKHLKMLREATIRVREDPRRDVSRTMPVLIHREVVKFNRLVSSWDRKEQQMTIQGTVQPEAENLQQFCGKQALYGMGSCLWYDQKIPVGMFNIEPMESVHTSLPRLVGFGVSLADALKYICTGPTPTIEDLVELKAGLSALARLATHGIDSRAAAIAYSGCGTYRIATADWEQAAGTAGWLPDHVFSGFEEHVDRQLFVDLVALYILKLHRSKTLDNLLRDDEALKSVFNPPHLGGTNLMWYPRNYLGQISKWFERRFAAIVAQLDAMAKGNESVLDPLDRIVSQMICVYFAPFCEWNVEVAAQVDTVSSDRFFHNPTAETVAPVPTTPFLSRVDAAFGLRIAEVLRRIVDEAVRAHGGGWAHFQQERSLAPYPDLAAAIEGVRRAYSSVQQTLLVAQYLEKSVIFITAIDSIADDPKKLCYIENKTIIGKTVKVGEGLQLKPQDARRIALLSAVLALAFRVPNYNRISTPQSLNLSTLKPIGIGASRDGFGILKCGARLLLKMLLALDSGPETDSGRNLFVLLSVVDIVCEWDKRNLWLLAEPATGPTKYFERFRMYKAAMTVSVGLNDELKSAAALVYRGEDASLTDFMKREKPSCASKEAALEERLREWREKYTTLADENRALKRKLEEFQGGPSTSGEAPAPSGEALAAAAAEEQMPAAAVAVDPAVAPTVAAEEPAEAPAAATAEEQMPAVAVAVDSATPTVAAAEEPAEAPAPAAAEEQVATP